MRKFIALKTLGILAILMSFGMVRGQIVAPSYHPKSAPTALTPQDEAAIKKNKEAWVTAHPDTYQDLNGQRAMSPTEATQMTAKEKVAFYQANMTESAQRQQATSAYPWGAPENKEAWVASHTREYQHMSAAPIDTRTVITKDELSKLPASKQQAISNDPNHVVIDTPSDK